MLKELSIKNFVLVDKLNFELSKKLNVITGETGAGKSILLSALQLTLGARADYSQIKSNCSHAEIIAVFDIVDNPLATQYLQTLDIEISDNECIIRRIIKKDSSSKAWINGVLITIKQLAYLSSMLINIHGQHEYQKLFDKSHHCQTVDDFGEHHDQTLLVHQYWNQWQTKQKQLDEINVQQFQNQEKVDLLSYYIEELSELNLQEFEYENLSEQLTLLNNSGEIIALGDNIDRILQNDEINVRDMLVKISLSLAKLPAQNNNLKEIDQLITQTIITVEEIVKINQHNLNSIELNAEKLTTVEHKLQKIVDLARKHKIAPSQLYAYYQNLQNQHNNIIQNNKNVDNLKQEIQFCKEKYLEQAQKLSQARKQSATKLEKAINVNLRHLSMPHTNIKIHNEIKSLDLSTSQGIDSIEFLVITNQGQIYQPLKKIASGGELSRINLAMAVVIAQKTHVGTIVFDEIDSGVGGAAANAVGLLLKQLSQFAQVFCITHSPQIASMGENHVYVEKQTSAVSGTNIAIKQLMKAERITEIARMTSGNKTNKAALELAQNLIEQHSGSS